MPFVSRIAERSQLSAAEYLEWERNEPRRHEFFWGEVFAVAGGSPRHNALCSRVNAALRLALGGRGCEAFSSDQRIGVGPGERYVYPDVSVVCGQVALEAGTTDVIANPALVVEVLSASTEQYDRGVKWEGYQRLESLADYVLVSQSEPRIEHFGREAGGSWIYRSFGAGQRVMLKQGIELDTDAIFAAAFELPGD